MVSGGGWLWGAQGDTSLGRPGLGLRRKALVGGRMGASGAPAGRDRQPGDQLPSPARP